MQVRVAGIPQIVVTTVFTAAYSYFWISPNCRIDNSSKHVGCLQSKYKRDQLKQGKTRGSCVLPHKGGLAHYNERFCDKIFPQFCVQTT